MVRRVFISLVLGVSGNVNADAGVGTRIPMKKIISWNKEVRAFVSPRCIRRGIRNRLAEKGFKIDPLMITGKQLGDVGDPLLYVDDDLFGYLAPKKGKGELQPARSGPVKISPLISLHHTEISVEFAGRFPRRDISIDAQEGNPVPFEIETAQWIGEMHAIISDYIGIFHEDELTDDVKKKIERGDMNIERLGEKLYKLSDEERRRRIGSLLEVLLREGWLFPRGSEAVSHPKYYYAVILLSNKFLPLANILKLKEDFSLDIEGIIKSSSIYEWNKGFIIDYINGKIVHLTKAEDGVTVDEKEMSNQLINEVISVITKYLVSS